MPELEPVRGFTPRAFIIGLLLVLIWVLYDCTLAVAPAIHTIEVLYLIGFGALFTIFVVSTINRCLPERRRLTSQELTIIYAMVAIAIPWGILVRGAIESPMKLIIVSTSKTDKSIEWIKQSIWTAQGLEAREAFARGGLAPWQIPWRAWTTPMLYWAGMLASFQMFAVFVVLFFRRLFIEEERLPFPLAQAGEAVIEYRAPKPDDGPGTRFQTIMRIGFVVGFLFCLPGIISVTPASHSAIPMSSTYYGTSIGIIPGLAVRLSWDPFVLCFLLLFPADVLLTAGIFYVGTMIVIPIACRWMGVTAPPVSHVLHKIYLMGGICGLAFWTVVFNYGRIKDWMRRAWSNDNGRVGNDPVSIRVVTIGMVLSYAAFMVLFIYGVGDLTGNAVKDGTPGPYHTLKLAIAITWGAIILVIFLFAVMRMRGEQGWHYHSPWTMGFVNSYAHLHYLGIYNTQASFLTTSNIMHFGAFHNAFAPHLHVLDSLKVAYGTNTKTRDVMKAVFLTFLIVLIVVIPLYLIVVHYYGFDRSATKNTWFNFWSYEQSQHAIAFNTKASTFNRIPPWWMVISGVTLMGVIMYYRREKVGFPLSPVGVIMAGGMSYFGNYNTSVIWLPILMIYVVKRLVYRWFGVKFFREKVIPVVLFVMMGLMTGMLIFKLLFAAMGQGFLRPY